MSFQTQALTPPAHNTAFVGIYQYRVLAAHVVVTGMNLPMMRYRLRATIDGFLADVRQIRSIMHHDKLQVFLFDYFYLYFLG
jgi:hypothetical protein